MRRRIVALILTIMIGCTGLGATRTLAATQDGGTPERTAPDTSAGSETPAADNSAGSGAAPTSDTSAGSETPASDSISGSETPTSDTSAGSGTAPAANTVSNSAAAMEQIRTLTEQQNAVLAKISDADQQLVSTMVEIDSLEVGLAKSDASIADTRNQLTDAESDADRQYETMKKRIRYLYENADGGTWLIELLGKGNISELLSRVSQTQELYDYDKKALTAYTETVQHIEDLKNSLENDRQKQLSMKEACEAQKEQLNVQLAALKAESSDGEARLASARAAAQEIAALEKQQAEQQRAYLAAQAAAEQNQVTGTTVSTTTTTTTTTTTRQNAGGDATQQADGSTDTDTGSNPQTDPSTNTTPTDDRTGTATQTDTESNAQASAQDALAAASQAAAEADLAAQAAADDQAAKEAAARKAAEAEAARQAAAAAQQRADAEAAAAEAARQAAAQAAVAEAARAAEEARGSGNAALGEKIANFACSYQGKVPYVYGKTDLNSGVDCSGFVNQVFANFGISVPRFSFSFLGVGTAITLSQARPGDIIVYSGSGPSGGHVGIYIGGGQIINALNENVGVVVSNASFMPILGVRRVV